MQDQVARDQIAFDSSFRSPLPVLNPASIAIVGASERARWALPEPPQHAMVIVPAQAVQGVIETGIKAGLESATIYASQIGEGEDPQIVARGTALKAVIEASGLRVCGPNCMGAIALRERYFGYPNTELCQLTPGSVALVTQSGGTLQYLGQAGAQRGVKFNYLTSSPP